MDPEIRSLSFVDIAKEVGRRWQTLSPDKKRVWESHAARAMQEYEAQMDDYKRTESWRKYQTYLNEFKARQSQNAKLKRSSSSQVESFLRGDSSRASPASSDSPGSFLSSASLGTDAELIHNALTLALSELVSLRSEILAREIQPYDANHLPPEEWVRQAMHAFVERTGSLIYIWTHSDVDEILDRIYRPTIPVDSMTLAECFTVAAMGALYDMEVFSERVQRLLYASGSLQFNEQSARVDYMRTTRLLLSMSFYALLEKHMSARYLICKSANRNRRLWISSDHSQPLVFRSRALKALHHHIQVSTLGKSSSAASSSWIRGFLLLSGIPRMFGRRTLL